jgi:hypothetical protein
VPFNLKKPLASLSGAGGLAHESHEEDGSQHGAPRVQADKVNPPDTIPGPASHIGAIPVAVFSNGAYSSVNPLRKNMETNPNLRGGVRVEKASVGRLR